MNLQEFKEFKKTLEVGKIYSNCDTFKILDNYFRQSPIYFDKTKNGLKGYVFKQNKKWGDNYCVFVIDNYENEVSFSENVFKKSSAKFEVLKAFRTTIYPEIKKFKLNFKEGITRCQISGKIIENYEELHVDHYDNDFIVVVDLFLKKYKKTFKDLKKYVVKKDSVRSFNNQKLIEYFIKFHNSHTNLRFTLKEENLKRKKKK